MDSFEMRYFIYLLIFISLPVFADTYPATKKFNCPTTSYTASGDYNTQLYIYESSQICADYYTANRASTSYTFEALTEPNPNSSYVSAYNNGTLFSYLAVAAGFTCPYGGTLSGTDCINAPSCPAGQTRDPVTGECQAPCPPEGETKVIGVQNLAGQSTNPGGEMVISITEDSTSTHTVISDTCEYTYSAADFAGKCYTSASATPVNGEKPMTCEYTATSKGTKSTATATAIDPATSKPADAVNTPNPKADCVTDSKGNTSCRSTAEAGKQCGTVNGVKICVDTATPGTGTVNGQPYQVSDKNCGWLNGKPVCVSSEGSNSISTTQGCVKNGAVVQCLNSDIKETTTKSATTANPDGTTTSTETTTNNEIGSTPSTTTTTTNTDGSTTTTTTGGSPTGAKKSDTVTDCDKYPDTAGCKTPSELFGEVGGTEGGVLDTETPVIGIDANSSWGEGSCPAPKNLNLNTTADKSWSYQPTCDFMSMMRPFVISMGWLIAGFIVLN